MKRWTQRDFGDQGEYPLALGSVFGVRWWSLNPTGLLHGVKAEWWPEENQAECLAAGRSPTSSAFRRWAQGAGPSVFGQDLSTSLTAAGFRGRVLNYDTGSQWHPGQGLNPEAFEEVTHDTPADGCTCGFYAFWEAEPAPVEAEFPVAGVIEGYGRTVIGNRGFRCQKARIVALHVPLADDTDGETATLVSEVESRLSDRYVVPVYATMRLMLLRHPPTKDYSG